MSTQTENPKRGAKVKTPAEEPDSVDLRNPATWLKRGTFPVGRNRFQRRRQLRQQVQFLIAVLVMAVLAACVYIYLNWLEAGSTKTVSCDAYPQYCVPLVGGGQGSADIVRNESAETRTLDKPSTAAPGVVRGLTSDNVPFIGDPNAPIHFAMVSDFACSHCQDFHRNDLKRFINDYVLTGKATLQLVMLSGTGGAFSDTATMGALCAGEQGAFWEMSDELFRLASAMAPEDAFRESQINKSANAMGLDGGKVLSCISSGRYASFLSNFRRFSNDHGITGTPTVLVSYGDGVWTAVSRDYDTLKSLTEKANAQSQ